MPAEPPSVLTPRPPSATPPRPPGMRAFGDIPATRAAIYDRALSATRSLPPLSNGRHTLELVDVDWADPPDRTKQEQKRAVLEGRTLGRRLRGTWRLRDDNTGEVLEDRQATVASIPWLDDHGTFIYNGVKWSIGNQMRLLPGIYTRERDNGEIEAHVNVMAGDGLSHRIHLDPAKSRFHVGMGQASLPLLPLLRSLGATDDQLREAWGQELFAAAMSSDDPSAIRKYQQRLLKPKELELDDQGRREALAAAIGRMRLDPAVTRRSLGREHTSVGLDSLLDATRKLIALSRGEAEVDDRDHLANQRVMGVEDLIAERLSRDYGGARRALLAKASRGGLGKIPAAALSSQVASVLLKSGLAQPLEEINLAEVLDKQGRVTRMGEGGISSAEAVPEEARALQPSHFAFVDPVRTPESGSIGVDVYFSHRARKGDDGRIYAPFKDIRTGETVWRSPQDVADLAITFPREMRTEGRRVWAMKGGRERRVRRDEVDLEVPEAEDLFSPLANLIPFKSAARQHRAAMGSRMITQALPLVRAEAPLVRVGFPGRPGHSYEAEHGTTMGAIRSPGEGRVMSVSDDAIVVRGPDGRTTTHELHNNLPFNAKTFLHQTATVRPGDTVTPGQLLARSNFTDDQGVTALGTNARVAYIPYRGHNFEDAIVISEGMANRLTSIHMYQHELEKTPEHKLGRGAYVSLFPSKFNRSQLETIDKNGLIKPGTRVEEGDPLILSAIPRTVSRNQVHRRGGKLFSDRSVVWEHSTPGVVTDVVDTPKGAKVIVRTERAMQVGDKMSGRVGDKGVVSLIVPDAQMPHDAEGRPYEVLLNPAGTISRGNPEQAAEAGLGKVAALTGRPFQEADFGDIEDIVGFAREQLRRHGLKDRDRVIDPATGRRLRDTDGREPLTGVRFFMKLHHMAEDKVSGRGIGGGYTADDAPAKGKRHGAKRFSMMDVNALLSAGATQVANDASLYRGQSNQDFWLSYMQGHTPPPPKVPHTWEKFVSELKAAGANVVSDGPGLHLMALTGKDVREQAGGRVLENSETVDFDRDMTPTAGGLLDPKLFGEDGSRWASLRLHEPLPSPVMEEPIRRLLGLTKEKFSDLLAGRHSIQRGDATLTGPDGLRKALEAIDLDREIDRTREQIQSGRKSARDDAVRRMQYLRDAKRLGMHPSDWVWDHAPVLPARFRPVSVMGQTGQPLVADANYLYKELFDANQNLQELSGELDDVGDERLALYNSLKAVAGLGAPSHPKLVEKGVKGLLQHVFGSSPKFGTVQRRLLGGTVNLVGRGVITPNPDLDMDSIGVPETMAWDVFQPMIVRRLRRDHAMDLRSALRSIEERTPTARRAMLDEMESRPVIASRAPVLHRFGDMAFRARPVAGDTIQVSPLVVKGFGADFDGDQMSLHVPFKDDAVREAEELLLPSRNLISPSDFKTPMHMPGQEYVAGLYEATREPSKQRAARRFQAVADVIRAFQRGELDVDTPVDVGD